MYQGWGAGESAGHPRGGSSVAVGAVAGAQQTLCDSAALLGDLGGSLPAPWEQGEPVWQTLLASSSAV